MATLTITVDPNMLERARKNALARRKTLEERMEHSLASLAEPNEQMRAVEALEALVAKHPFRVDHGSYTRAELHQRGG